MNQEKLEIVKTVKGYDIVKFYANTENGHYGDIFTSKDDVLATYPDTEVMEGYGFVCPITGFCPDEAGDWYKTVEETEEAILNLPL